MPPDRSTTYSSPASSSPNELIASSVSSRTARAGAGRRSRRCRSRRRGRCPLSVGHRAAAIDVAAGDRAAPALRGGTRRRGGSSPVRSQPLARPVAARALEDPPAVVAAALDAIDLLAAPWPTSPASSCPVRRSKEKRQGLRSPSAKISGRPPPRDERVVGRDARRAGRRRRRCAGSCRAARPGSAPVAGIAAGAAVAEADVEEAVGAEGDHAAVVVGERLGDGQQHALAPARATVGVGRDPVLRDDAGPVVLARVVDEEAAVAREARMEGEPEQATLAAGKHPARDVEEGLRQQRALLEDPDPPRLLDHEQAPAAVARMGQEDRGLEALDHRLEPQLTAPRPPARRSPTGSAPPDSSGGEAPTPWRRQSAQDRDGPR